MPRIPFPNVPADAGVPQIPRSPSVPPIVQAGLGLLQGMIWRIFQVQSNWGIFDSKGVPLGDPAQISNNSLDALGLSSSISTGSVEYVKETSVSDFPIEKGSFASYNKVERASTPKVTLLFSGSESDRSAFLGAIDAACKSTDLYSVVTPEVTYINYSVEWYDYQRRNDRGANLLTVKIALKEIRQVSATYGKSSKPKEPSATPAADNGKVQPEKPKVSTLKSLSKKTPGLAGKVGTYLQGLSN